MADIFLSYARVDKAFAQRFADTLGDLGYEVFWDPHILPGATYRKVIQSELARANCVIVVWSKASIESEWVIDEAEEAKARRALIPVIIDDVKPPAGFRQQQAVTLTNWAGSESDHRFKSIVSAIGQFVNQPGHRTPARTMATVKPTSSSDLKKIGVAIFPAEPSLLLLAMNLKTHLHRNVTGGWGGGSPALGADVEVLVMDDGLFDASRFDLVIRVSSGNNVTRSMSPTEVAVQYLSPDLYSDVIVRQFTGWLAADTGDSKPVALSEGVAILRKRLEAILSDRAPT